MILKCISVSEFSKELLDYFRMKVLTFQFCMQKGPCKKDSSLLVACLAACVQNRQFATSTEDATRDKIP